MWHTSFLSLKGDASDALQSTWREKSERLQTHTQSPGALVLYDTNLAREFVRDVKTALTAANSSFSAATNHTKP